MYLLAEATFKYSDGRYAYLWYENAFKFGKSNALNRYYERLAEVGLTKEKVLK